MTKKRVLLLGAVLLICMTAVLASPKLKTQMFVRLYHDDIEHGLSICEGVPADDAVLFGYKYVNSWEGEHPMTEFLIATRGLVANSEYFGCYYSPDDVPLAFQNTTVELTQDGHDRWVWQAEGDNHGYTEKIMDHWYYFSAAF